MERFGGHCGVDHRKVRRWEQGQCVPDICHQEVICDLFELSWEEREQLGFGNQLSPEIESAATCLRGLLSSLVNTWTSTPKQRIQIQLSQSSYSLAKHVRLSILLSLRPTHPWG
jgi:hypothetical protein